jgi:hypothetical protein
LNKKSNYCYRRGLRQLVVTYRTSGAAGRLKRYDQRKSFVFFQDDGRSSSVTLLPGDFTETPNVPWNSLDRFGERALPASRLTHKAHSMALRVDKA